MRLSVTLDPDLHQVADAWLAGLARRRGGRVATRDAAFAAAHPEVVDLLPEGD